MQRCTTAVLFGAWVGKPTTSRILNSVPSHCVSKNNAKNISGLEIFGSNWKAIGKQLESRKVPSCSVSLVLLSTALSARYEEYPPPEMPCQLGGPRFLMPPRVALAAWCLWKLGRTISSAMFTRQVSSAMAPLAFAAASWRMAMPNAVQLQTQALVEPRSLTCPSWKALGSIKHDRQAAFARNSPTSAPIATRTATSTAASMEREL